MVALNTFYFLVLAILAILKSGECKKKCTMTRADADRCASGVIILGNREIVWPSNLDEGRKFCKSMRMSAVCVGRYRHCVTGFKKSLIGAFYSYAIKEIDRYCNDVILKLVVENAKCLRDPIRKEEFIKCTDRHVVMTNYILANVTSIDKVSASCCAFVHFRECYHKFAEAFCTDVVGDETARLIDEITLRLVNTFSVCSERFSSAESCAISFPKYDKVFTEIGKDYDIPPNKKTVLMDLFDLFSDQ